VLKVKAKGTATSLPWSAPWHRCRQATQHYLLLQRNLVYTGVTRGNRLVVLIGQRKALAIAVRNNKTENRFSGLLARLKA
jgi:ATP-dependent exoDNAse (exonuclease V) alpha subunit